MEDTPRILIVDDDESTRRTLTLIFGKQGYAAEAAATGREAIEKAQEEFFNLALLDIKLPDMEGVELIAPLKEMHPDMEVLMVTAYASTETAVQALNDGASAYINKPLNMDEVVANIRQALEKQRLVWEKRRAEETVRERVKELTCLYAVRRDMQEDLSVEGLCRRVVEHLVPAMQFPEITVPMIELDGKRFTSKRYTEGLSHGLHAEIRVRGEARGQVWIYYTKDRRFLIPEEQNLVNGVGGALGRWLERQRAEKEAQQRADQAALAYEVGRRVSAKLDLDELLSEIVTAVRDAFDYYGVMILLVDEEAQCLTMQSIAGGYAEIFPRDLSHAIGEGMTGHVAASGETRVSGDVNKDPHYVREADEETKSELAVPIKSKEKVIGVLDIQSDEFDAFDETDVMAMETLADQVAVAIENARLYEAVEQELSERKRAQVALQRSERQLAIRNRISDIFLTTPDEEMYGEVLQVVLEAMESKYGIFGYMDEAGDLVCPSMTKDVWDQCQIPDKDIVFPRQTWGGIWGWALKEKKPLYSNESFPVPEGHIPIHRAVDVPIVHRGEVIGNLLVGNKATDYGQEDCELLEAVADHIAPILHARLQRDREERERQQAQEEIRRYLERIEAVQEVDRAIISTLGLTEVLDVILEELERVLPYHSAAIFLLSDGTAKVAAARGHPDPARALEVSFPVQDDTLIRQILREKCPLVLADAQADQRFLARGGTEYVRSWIGVPLIAKEKPVGFLTIDHREAGVYDEESGEMAEAFASQVAIAIENARLYEEAQRELAERKQAEAALRQSHAKLQRALEGTVHALGSAVELRDPYTAGHQRQVARLACAIATEMDLDEERIEGLRLAALIHDMGKITIPAEVLSKPGELNNFEWGLIKAHPQIGHNLLKDLDFPWPLADIVLQHHERLDGSGYPQGLSDGEIMLEARVLAVSDVVEAMASHRPYRPTRGIDQALEEISQNRGRLYDAQAVDACLKLFTEKGFEFE